MSTIITGSVAYDYIMDFPGYFKDHIMPEKIHVLNLSFLVNTMKRKRGGVAANIAYTMALLGAPPPFLPPWARTTGPDYEEVSKHWALILASWKWCPTSSPPPAISPPTWITTR